MDSLPAAANRLMSSFYRVKLRPKRVGCFPVDITITEANLCDSVKLEGMFITGALHNYVLGGKYY